MEANKNIAEEISFFEQNLSTSHLKAIAGYTFTNREVDIIACLSSGKSAKKIAAFLSISPKTVENHIHNIMVKLGCGTQEKVREFIENSGKFLLIKKHYSDLLVRFLFEIELKKLSTQVIAKDLRCSILYGENNVQPALLKLDEHLRSLGIQTSINIQKHDENEAQFISRINSQEPNFIFYGFGTKALIKSEAAWQSKVLKFFDFIQSTNNLWEKLILLVPNVLPLTNFPPKILDLKYLDLTKQQNYYYFLFAFLKNLFPTTPLDHIILEFKRKYELYNEPFPSEGVISIKKSNTPLQGVQEKKVAKLRAITVIFFLTLFFLCFYFVKKQNNIDKDEGIVALTMLSQIRAGIPFNWNLPRQDLLFVGRVELLEKLHYALHTPLDGDTSSIVACTGLGGIGKTQFALQYALSTIYPYKLKVWFSAKNREALELKYIEFARQLGCQGEPISIESAIFYVKNWLTTHNEVLFVFDNILNYEEIYNFLPEKGAKVIITTRNQSWPKKIQVLPIDIMSEKEAIELINQVLERADPDAKILTEKLEYLPLALAQASAYIKYNKIHIFEYLDLYSKYQEEMLADPTLPAGADHDAVALTWNVSIETIEKKSKKLEVKQLARIFLTASSYFASEKIPISVLNKWLVMAYPKIKNPELLTHQLLTELQNYSLLKINTQGQTFNVNRLVRSVMRDQHKAEKMNTIFYPNFSYKWYQTLLYAINTEFDLKTESTQDGARQINLLPHLQRLTEYYEALVSPENQGSVILAKSFFNIGSVLLRTGSAKLAKPYYERALKIQAQNFGKNHPIVIETLTKLEDVYKALENKGS